MNPIHSIGIANLDHLILVPPSARGGGHVLAFREDGGGIAATAVVAAARLGAPTRIWSRVGGDEIGRKIVAGLEREGVDTRSVQVLADRQSAVSVVQVDAESGARAIYHIRGDLFERADVALPSLDGIEAAGAVIIDHIWKALAFEASRRARPLGIPVVGDLNLQRAPELASAVDYLIVSEPSARHVAPDGGPEAALERLRAMGPRFVAITMGERGCLYANGDEVRHVPSYRVEVVDTTGAGDAFHGAFAFALAQGWEIEDAVKLGCAVGALACRALGGRASLPDLKTAMRLMGGA